MLCIESAKEAMRSLQKRFLPGWEGGAATQGLMAIDHLERELSGQKIWFPPDTTPNVEKGSESEFWIAVHSEHSGRKHVFLAQYQNRPLELDENGDPLSDEMLIDCDGDYIGSVGWVSCKEHLEFSNYYEPIGFDENYVLLGWAEYVPPVFGGVNV